MASHNGKQAKPGNAADGTDRSDAELGQDATEQRDDEALEDHRRHPSPGEKQVRREQGGHDRPVGPDHVPQRRPEPGKGGAGS